MLQPTLNHVVCPDATGSHRMAYWSWGDPASRHVIVCVHGLSRQGRDFDVLAQAICQQAKHPVLVVCPDMAGRGQSDWLKDPMGYQVPNYAADMLVLLAQLAPSRLDWVGTSMGGLIGLVVCGQPDLPLPVTVSRLVLNDVGPTIQWEAIQRISKYLGKSLRFASLEEAAQAMWIISSSFGPHTPAQWLALCKPMLKTMADDQGGYALHYDPAIAIPFGTATQETTLQGEQLLWHLYDQIKASTLLIRGALSDLLTQQTALTMTQRGPRAKLIEFEDVGHAPTLVTNDQVSAVVSFLLAP